MELKYHSASPLSHAARTVLSESKAEVFGDTPVQMIKSEPGPGVVTFGGDPLGGIYVVHPSKIATTEYGRLSVQSAFRKVLYGTDTDIVPWDCDPTRVLYFDIESHSVDERWNLDPRTFFRLGQYAWGPRGEVHLTTDYDEMIEVIRSAHGVVGHNIHDFDLSVLFGKDSTEPLEMALEGRVFDTFTYSILTMPAPVSYENRAGSTIYPSKPMEFAKWLSLDNLSFQLGLTGKIGDLKALAKKYGGFCHIPVDDPEFVEYAIQDVVALQALTTELITMKEPTEYDWREQINAAIDAQNSRNGIVVDVEAAQARVAELAARREVILDELRKKYDFPTEGKAPWSTTVGKAAIMKALADKGITPKTVPNWKKTATGNISLGGEVLLEITEGTEAEDLGTALAELKGQRPLAQLALDCTQSDGRAHPEITALQRSGRKSTTRPSLTTWSARGEKAVEKRYFVASPGHVLVEFDYSAADARAVAALSGDAEFAKRFEPGADMHSMSGVIFFGHDEYYADKERLRPLAKAGTHSLGYRVGSMKLASLLGLSQAEALTIISNYQQAYPDVHKWQERVTRDGESGSVTNAWGRKMPVERERSFTQSSSLHGQSTTRELVVDALIQLCRLGMDYAKAIRMQVHDALVMEFPEDRVDEMVATTIECMEAWFHPPEGQAMFFPVEHGVPAKDWWRCGH